MGRVSWIISLVVLVGQISVGCSAYNSGIAWNSVRCQMRHFLSDLMRIFSRSQVGRESFVTVIETDYGEADEYKDAAKAIATQDGSRSVTSRKDATKYGTASTTSSIVNERQDSLGGRAQFGWCIVGDVRASSSPNGRMSHTLDQLEGNHAPRFANVRNVEEAQHIAQQTQGKNLQTNI